MLNSHKSQMPFSLCTSYTAYFKLIFWLAYKRKDSSNEAFPYILNVTCLSHIFKLKQKKKTQNTELQQILRKLNYTCFANSNLNYEGSQMSVVSKHFMYRGFHLIRWMTFFFFFFVKYFCCCQCDMKKSHQFFIMQNKLPCLEWSVLASSWLLVIVRSFLFICLLCSY